MRSSKLTTKSAQVCAVKRVKAERERRTRQESKKDELPGQSSSCRQVYYEITRSQEKSVMPGVRWADSESWDQALFLAPASRGRASVPWAFSRAWSETPAPSMVSRVFWAFSNSLSDSL